MLNRKYFKHTEEFRKWQHLGTHELELANHNSFAIAVVFHFYVGHFVSSHRFYADLGAPFLTANLMLVQGILSYILVSFKTPKL